MFLHYIPDSAVFFPDYIFFVKFSSYSVIHCIHLDSSKFLKKKKQKILGKSYFWNDLDCTSSSIIILKNRK